jgi:hypothetical protein
MLLWALDDPEGSRDDDDVMTFRMDGHVRSHHGIIRGTSKGKQASLA